MRLLNATLLRTPVARAVFHFISQTLMRVQRYRIYLVLYGGVGLSVIVSSILRLSVEHGQVRMRNLRRRRPSGYSHRRFLDHRRVAHGLRLPWEPAGQLGVLHRPWEAGGPRYSPGANARRTSLGAAVGNLISLGACLASRALAPAELRNWAATASLTLIAVGMCLVLSDAFFMNVRVIAFTGDTAREQPNLALTVLKYFTLFPIVVWIPVVLEPWIAAGILHFGMAALAVAAAHIGFQGIHRRILQEHCAMPGLEEDEEDFPMKLGLRY